MKSLVSLCCDARAMIDRTAPELTFFCVLCGQTCTTKEERTGFDAPHKSTGEAKLFREIWDSNPHRCMVCKTPIKYARPENFSHLLPKGNFPDYQTDIRNVVLKCDECHATWHREPKGLLLADERWAPWVQRYELLKREAYRKGRFVETDTE